MNELTMDELKQVELEVLVQFAAICEQNGLRYFLGGGTLLGAVRHQGFIPWDDDVDVYMPRPDYMKLMQINPAVYDENLKLFSHYHREDYYHPFARLCDMRTRFVETKAAACELGVFIDIFPVDGLPADIASSNSFFKQIDFLHRMRLLSVRNKLTKWSFFECIVKMPFAIYARALGPKFWVRRIDRLVRKYGFESSDFVGMLVSINYGTRERMDKPSFAAYMEMEFEGYRFQAPIGYDKYLTQCYGDYMTPPPENKRFTKHAFAAYRRQMNAGLRPAGVRSEDI